MDSYKEIKKKEQTKINDTENTKTDKSKNKNTL